MFEQIISLCLWYVLTFVGGIYGTFILSKLFYKPFSYFYGLGRVAWLLIFGYISWILISLNILKFSPLNLWILFIILTGSLLFILLRTKNFTFKDFICKEALLSEFMYLIVFIVFSFYLFHFSSYTRTEDYMNIGIMSNLLKTLTLPPKDMWFSSYNLNYYYFGHYLYSIPLKMLEVRSGTGMSIALIGLFSNSTITAFWIFLRLLKSKLFSFLGVYFLLISGNLYLWKVLFQHGGFSREAFNFSATLNDGGVAYFPVYTFFLGGFHANVINLAIILLLIAFLYLTLTLDFAKPNILAKYLFSIALTLGAIFTTNTWDVLVCGALIFLVMLISFGIKKAFTYSFLVLFVSLVLFLPYHLKFLPSGFYGIGIPHDVLSIESIFTMFGVFLTIFFVYLVYKGAFNREYSKFEQFILVLGFLGLILAFTPRYIVFKDLLFTDNPKFYRSNTFYKFWYEGWIFLSVFCTYALYKLINKLNVILKIFLVLTIVTISGIYPGYLFVSQFKGIRDGVVKPNLDGTSYLLEKDSDTYHALNYLNVSVSVTNVILEPRGDQYTHLHAIFSSYSGIPTVVGVYQHERVWRGAPPEVMERVADVDLMYKSDDVLEVSNLLTKYKVDYIIINEIAYELYGESAGETLELLADPVFITPTVKILKVNPAYIPRLSFVL